MRARIMHTTPSKDKTTLNLGLHDVDLLALKICCIDEIPNINTRKKAASLMELQQRDGDEPFLQTP